MDITAEFADIATFGGFFGVDTAPSGPCWRPIPDGMDARIEVTHKALRGRVGRGDVDPRISASLTHLNVVARVVSPTLALAGRHGVVPVLGNMMWRPTLGGSVPLGVPQPLGVPASVQAIDEQVLRPVVEPLMRAVTRTVPTSSKVLLGNVGSALNGAVEMVSKADPGAGRRAGELVRGLLAATSRAGTGSYVDGRFRRSSCCLYYRIDASAGYCADCVLT